VRGAWGGLKARGEEIQEKGVLGIGGAQRVRETEAKAKGWIAGIPGLGRVPGAREEASRAMAAETDKELKKLQTLNLTLDQLNEKLKSASKPERLAAFKLKAENGWLEASDADEVVKMIKEAGGGRTAMGGSIIQSLKKGRFHEMAKSTSDKEIIFNKFAPEDLELAKSFGLDMAESKELMNATLATRLLDLYKGDALEIKKKVEKAVKDNIENIAKEAASRKDLVNGVGSFTDADDRIRKLAGQVITEKKEVGSWKLRNQVLKLNGGMNDITGEALTVEGRGLVKDILAGNVAIKEEAEYRKARPAIPASTDLDPAQRIEVEEQIITSIKSGLIRSLDTEDLKSPAVFNALVNGRTRGLLTPDEYNKALGLVKDKKTGALEIRRGKPDRKRRKAINDIVTATSPMAYP